jgi:anti-sigma regulatory factor (Ser/Thr protein kinase)/anti-anti-sigma regulatory factor
MTSGPSERAVDIAFDTDPDCVLVTEGSGHAVLAANPAARRLLAAVGEVDAPLRSLVGSGMRGLRAVCDRVLETGVAHEDPRCLVGDTTVPATRRMLHVVARPWSGRGGEIGGVVLRAHDEVDTARHPRLPASREASVPLSSPLVPGLDIGALCLLGDARMSGGDWLDVVVRPSGSVCLVVGSVSTGADGGSAAGRLRAVLRDHLGDEGPVSAVLARVDRFARDDDELRAAVLCVAEVDAGRGLLTWCAAGQNAPLLLAAGGGPVEPLPGTGARPLGTGGSYPVRTRGLRHDDLVLLYSNDALHHGDQELGDAAAALARVLRTAVLGPASAGDPARATERACRHVTALLVGRVPRPAGFVLVAAQAVPAIIPFVARHRAEPRALASVRRELGRWMEAVGVTDDDALVLQHVVGELAANVVEHAYVGREGGGDLWVDAQLHVGVLRCRVRDGGAWRDAGSAPWSGRGLSVAAGLADTLDVARAPDGTTVTVELAVGRPVELVTPAAPGPGPVPANASVVGDHGHVVVRGPLRGRAAAALSHRVRELSQGGTREVTVDLDGATLVDTTALQALFDITSRRGQRVRLRARDGTVAHRALQVAGLDHETDAGPPR